MIPEIKFRKATQDDADKIWEILQQAIERRRLDNSQQWQNGYPNPETINSDIEKQIGYVLEENDNVVALSLIHI